MSNRDAVLLGDVERSVQLIRDHAPADKTALHGDELLQAAVLRALTLIGRAAEGVSPELRAAYPHVRWDAHAELGHTLVERYYDVDLDRVCHAIQRDIPELEQHVEQILAEIE